MDVHSSSSSASNYAHHVFVSPPLCFQLFESSGITLMADSQYNGQARVQALLEYIQEREGDLEDLGAIRRIKLEQCIQLCQFESDANQASSKLWYAYITQLY